MSLNYADQVQKVGTVTVSNPAVAVNISLGWVPRYTKVYSINNLVDSTRFSTMAAGYCIDSVNSASTQQVINVAGGIADYAGRAAGGAVTGTVTVTAASAAVVGSSTNFVGELAVGDKITVNGEVKIILSITDSTHLTTTVPFIAAASTVSLYDMTGKTAGFTIGTDIMDTAADVVHWVAFR